MTDRRRIYMIRHGEASATWTQAHDPGLSALGAEQAADAAQKLAAIGALPVKSSPLKRARETAAPYAKLHAAPVEIIGAVAEIPSPGVALADRQQWLLDIMAGGWATMGAAQTEWRAALIGSLLAQPQDCAIFSHFVAINTAVGAANGVDDLLSFRPANASITIFETDGRDLTLIELGHEAQSAVR
ncbi:MAG: histidine phosphatase family protein [Parvularculaceae bacterium]